MSELLDLLRPDGGALWLVIGLVLMILEVVDGNFVLFSLGTGAALTGLVAFAGLHSVPALLGVCAVWQVLVFVLMRPVVLRALRGKGSTLTNVDALSGKKGTVTRAIGGNGEAGYVKVHGEEWRAVSANDQPIEAGTRVLVKDVSGATVRVVPEEAALALDEAEGRVSVSKRR